jgi:hypothetical protein
MYYFAKFSTYAPWTTISLRVGFYEYLPGETHRSLLGGMFKQIYVYDKNK